MRKKPKLKKVGEIFELFFQELAINGYSPEEITEIKVSSRMFDTILYQHDYRKVDSSLRDFVIYFKPCSINFVKDPTEEIEEKKKKIDILIKEIEELKAH